MRIVADENIPFAREAFGTLGDVVTASGRDISSETVKDADLLIVRSVTQVNEALLGGSRVRFVGTCTIGVDHLDMDYLRRRGIAFASAPGCNANSVAEYVTAALLVLAGRNGIELKGKSIAVIGVGNVGSRVVEKVEALGMRVLMNDPPLAERTGDERFLPLDEVLGADFVTVHVPLTKTGRHATYHMVGEEFMGRMREGATFINTSRGAVADTAALLKANDERRITMVLDVWENEPNISLELLERSAIATPHIAGYSFDGKVAATRMIYEAACDFLGVRPTWDPTPLLPAPPVERLELDGKMPDEEIIRGAVLAVYDIEGDDARLRRISSMPESERGAYFDSLRKNYPMRREFRFTTVILKGGREETADCLKRLGFKVEMV